MTDATDADDGREKSNNEHAAQLGGALDSIVEDAKDIRNAVAFEERNSEGRVSLELDHTVEDLSAAVERLERAQAAADAASDSTTEAFEVGDRAFVNEEDGGEVIILATPNVRAEDYVVPGTGKTVAEYNAKYEECSPSDPVVQATFVESIEATFGSQWTDESILELFDDGILADHADHYAYPDTRLTSDKLE